MKLNRMLIVGAAALAAGCATKEEAIYWTEKGDAVVVHHIRKTSSGLVDSTEKLSTKKVDDGALEKYDLPKGKRFSVVGSDQPVKLAEKGAKAEAKKKEPESKDKLAEVTSELHRLRSQVADVAAQNRRLEEKLNAPAQAQEQPGSGETAQQDTDQPRISQ